MPSSAYQKAQTLELATGHLHELTLGLTDTLNNQTRQETLSLVHQIQALALAIQHDISVLTDLVQEGTHTVGEHAQPQPDEKPMDTFEHIRQALLQMNDLRAEKDSFRTWLEGDQKGLSQKLEGMRKAIEQAADGFVVWYLEDDTTYALVPTEAK